MSSFDEIQNREAGLHKSYLQNRWDDCDWWSNWNRIVYGKQICN